MDKREPIKRTEKTLSRNYILTSILTGTLNGTFHSLCYTLVTKQTHRYYGRPIHRCIKTLLNGVKVWV